MNMLRELVQQRGPSYAARAFREGLYQAGMAVNEGKPSGFPPNEELDRIIGEVSHAIGSGVVRDPRDLEVTLPAAEERRLLDHIVRPFNFLKHADQDPLGTLDEADVRPLDALTHAITAYAMLFPGEALDDEVGSFLVRQGVID